MTDFDITILHAYMAGTASEEQERCLLNWLEASEENRRFFANFASNFTLHETLVADRYSDECEDMVSRLNSRIDAEEQARKAGSRARAAVGRFRRLCGSGGFGGVFAGICAVAATVALAFVLTRPRPAQPEPAQIFTYANSTTSVKSLLLADQTKIFLKPGSEIEYNVTGMPDRRVISLRGEAFFDVAKDSLRPMVVNTGELSVKVLGTAFTVRALPGTEDVEVVLERGSVRLLSKDGVGLVRLIPDQKACFNTVTGDVEVQSYNALPYVVDQFNLSSLDNVTTARILKYLEHIYGVRIQASIANPDRRYYFKFLKTDSIEDVLRIVEQLTGEHCTIATSPTTNNQ